MPSPSLWCFRTAVIQSQMSRLYDFLSMFCLYARPSDTCDSCDHYQSQSFGAWHFSTASRLCLCRKHLPDRANAQFCRWYRSLQVRLPGFNSETCQFLRLRIRSSVLRPMSNQRESVSASLFLCKRETGIRTWTQFDQDSFDGFPFWMFSLLLVYRLYRHVFLILGHISQFPPSAGGSQKSRTCVSPC